MTNYLFPVSQVETITPAIAAEYLKNNSDNRPLSKVVVLSYARTMERGEWMLNGSSIDFSTDGKLLNGQHRLMAVVQSGCTQQFFVTRGLDPRVYTTYDCGRSRTAGQLIGMQGVPNYNTTAACVKTSQFLKAGDIAQRTSLKGHLNLTNQNLITIFENDRDAYIDAVKKIKTILEPLGTASVLSAGNLSGIYYYLRHELKHDQETTLYFFQQVFSYRTSENPMLESLRVKFLKSKNGNSKLTNEAVNHLLIKCWNAYIDGRILKVIKWDSETEGKLKYK